jgi:hypothetical protein
MIVLSARKRLNAAIRQPINPDAMKGVFDDAATP